MKYLLILPMVLYLTGCTFALGPKASVDEADNDETIDGEPIGDSVLSETGLESVLAPPGVVAPAGVAASPESAILAGFPQTINPLPATSALPSAGGLTTSTGLGSMGTGGATTAAPTAPTAPTSTTFSGGPGSSAGAGAGAGSGF